MTIYIDTIKITSLGNLLRSELLPNTLLPVVSTVITPLTKKTTIGDVGNFILSQSGNLLEITNQALTAQTVTNAAQPNITSVGTLTSLTVNGNTALGYVDQVRILGGTDGYFLQTDGNGNLSWSAGGSGTGNGTPGGSNHQIQFNDSGLFGATGNLVFYKDTDTFGTVNGIFRGNVEIDGNATANIVTANYFIGNGVYLTNITGANVVGEVATANYASYAGIAFAVDGGNVIGNVANANYASYAGIAFSVDGANVVGDVGGANHANVADLANAVQGSNVIGAVGSANYSNFAGSLLVTGNINLNNFNINNLADPVSLQDAATKNYVDTVAQGLHIHDSCNVATTASLDDITGGTSVYNNGSGGIGANIIISGGSLTIIDFVVLTANMRILVKNEANAVWNGVYVYNNTSTITRATDFDTSAEALGGDFLFVTSGDVNADTGWVQTTDDPIIGTSPIVFTQFSGAGSYSAGTGLGLTGSQFYLANTTVTPDIYGNSGYVPILTVNQQGQITDATSVPIEAQAGLLLGGELSSNVLYSSLIQVGTLTSLSVSGNANIGNVGTENGYFAGDILVGDGDGGCITGANTISANYFIGTLTTNAQPNITSIGALTDLTVTGNANVGNLSTAGNITANYYFGNGSQLTGIVTNVEFPIANGNSNFDIATIDGNVTVTANGSQTWTFDSTGNLAFPGGGIIYSNPFTPSGAPGNTITLQPAGSGTITDQKLMIYPTAGDGDHIHMVTGNLYQTELFMGSDSFYAKLSNTGNFVIHPYDNNSLDCTYTFGYDGNFNLPGNLTINGLTSVFGSNVALVQPNDDIPLVLLASNSNSSVSSVWIENSSDVANSNISAIYTPFAGTGAVRIVNGNNATTVNIWDFGRDGNLTLPSNTFAVNYANGTQVSLGGGYGNSNVATFLGSFGSNTITTTGNVSVGNISATNLGNISSVNLTGSSSNVLYGNGAFAAPVAEAAFSIQTANFNASVGSRYGVNTSGGAVTATLPASPATGGAIFFADAGGVYASNNLTINPNGQTIMGASGNMTVSTNNQSVGLFYNGTTWRTYNAG